MEPVCANVDSYPLMRRPLPMECVDKPLWTRDARVCFPPLGPMIVGWWFSHLPMSTLLRRILANIKHHPHRTEGVQYATNSLACGWCGGHTCIWMPSALPKRNKAEGK